VFDSDELDTEWPVDWREYIQSHPNVLAGKPVVKDTRLSVEFLLGLFAGGWTEDMVLENYPQLSREGLRAVFAYASERIRGKAPTSVS
jgi:uncharacterized protein (DUF433 family)